MRKFFKEFKDFIARGNVLDLAVAVIIGGAFSAIVTALTNKIIMPLVNYVLMLIGGKEGLESAYTFLSKVYTDGELDLTKSIYIDWGAFITAILNFLIIAMTLFIIIKAFNRSRERIKAINGHLSNLSKKEKREEILAMRKEAKERGVSYKTVKKEHEEEKERQAKLALEKEEAEKKQKEEEQKESTNQLLSEIRDLLKQK